VVKARYYEESLMLHALHKGKLEIVGKVPFKTREDMSIAYKPGVAEPCLLIARDPEDARKYSIKANTIAVVSDGSNVLGLGNIGGLASLPAIEGKALLFKELGGIDAFPICLATQDVDEIVDTVKMIAPTFGGVCLEDIAAPRCSEVEKRLKKVLDIPVFCEQHGIAAAVCAAVINAARVLKKPLAGVKTVICGAGAAGISTAKMIYAAGVRDIVVCDSGGVISASRFSEFGEDKLELLEFTNRGGLNGTLADAVKGRDVFIGLSKPRLLTEDMVNSMAKDPVIFALSTPEPEIHPIIAKSCGARITGSGRWDFPNQISSALAFPGIFRGALDAGAKEITEKMKLAAAQALAGQVSDRDLGEEYILPYLFEDGLAAAVAKAVAAAC